MKVARNTTHNLRHDWLMFLAEKDTISVSLLAFRNEIAVEVQIDGVKAVDYFSPRQLAQAILSASTDPHEKEDRGEMAAWAAVALNCKQALAGLLKFHPQSPETGAELPPELWTPEYRDAVMRAAKCLHEASKE